MTAMEPPMVSSESPSMNRMVSPRIAAPPFVCSVSPGSASAAATVMQERQGSWRRAESGTTAGTLADARRQTNARPSWSRAFALVLPLLLAACSKDQPEQQSAPLGAGFPGHEPPALDQLLNSAAATPAQGSDVPYSLRTVAVPPLEPVELEQLPKDDEGRPVLASEQAMGLVVDETLADPITAKGDCLTLVSNCIASAGGSLDSCFASVPVCPSNQPWASSEPCCHARCQQLYAGLRGRDYSQLQAFELTAQSLCFPSLGEFLEANR